jgi:hypothetical protein
LKLYRDVLGYDTIEFDETGIFKDLNALNISSMNFRRILLSHSEKRIRGFSKLFGASQIELIQCLENTPNIIFKDRY